jgi:nitrate reductase NapAB chaperone NapD
MTDAVPPGTPLGFGELSVSVPTHLCLFYYDDVELRTKLGFVRIGLETESEAVVLFGRRSRLEQILGYLSADGLDVDAIEKSGRLVLVEGAADRQGLLANIAEHLDGLMATGVTLIRFLGFIGWEDPTWPTHDELLTFESMVNVAASTYPAVVMCTYKLTEIPGPLLIYGGIETHPLTIIGDTVCENPHYVPPDRYAAARAAGLAWLEPGRDRFEGVRISRGTPNST